MAHIEKTRAAIRVEFDGWTDFLDFVNRPPTHAWAQLYNSHEESRSGFFGTENWAEAENLARYGWPEGRARIVDGVQLAQRYSTALSAALAYDVGGEFPNVPLFVAGDPAHMVTQEPVAQRTRHVIRILVNLSASSAVSTKAYENRGIALLSAIDAAEQAGHRVELFAISSNDGPGKDGGKIALHGLIPLKRAGEHWDADRMAYALMHPSVHRRHSFSFIEQWQETERWSGSYGMPCKAPDQWLTDRTVYFGRIFGNEGARFSTVKSALDFIASEINRAITGADTAAGQEPETLAPLAAPEPAPTPAPAPTPRPRDMASRFPGKCHGCGARFERGALITYDKAISKVTACPSCRK